MPRSLDTAAEAEAMQTALYRKMSSEQKTRIAIEMSMDARATTLAAIRFRHRNYDDETARWALFRLLVGDELFHRVWPAAPMMEP